MVMFPVMVLQFVLEPWPSAVNVAGQCFDGLTDLRRTIGQEERTFALIRIPTVGVAGFLKFVEDMGDVFAGKVRGAGLTGRRKLQEHLAELINRKKGR